MLSDTPSTPEVPITIRPFVVHAKLAEQMIQLPGGVVPPKSHRCQIFLVAATSAEDARKILGMREDSYDFIDVFSIDDLLGKTKGPSKDQPA